MTQLNDSDNRTAPDGSDVDPPGAAPPEGSGNPPEGAAPDQDIVSDANPHLDELRLAAEEAEAEAVAAEAVAAAARARALASRLRRRAVLAANSVPPPVEPESAVAQPNAIAAAAAATGSAIAVPASVGTEPTTEFGPGTAPETAAGSASAGPVPTKPDSAATGDSKDVGSGGDSQADERSTEAITVAAPRRPQWLPSTRALVGACAVALIAVSGTVSGLLVHHHQETVQANQRRVEFTEAARQGVVALTSLDFSRAAQDVQRVLEHSTGAFLDDFEGRAQDFTSVIQQSQVATAGTVNSAAVESMTEDSAVVLIAATSQVTNSAGAQGEPRAWRLSVTVTREGDTIKMSKVEFVP